MNWTDVLTHLGTGLLGVLGTVLVARHLKGSPPASREAWDQIEREQKAKRDARNTTPPGASPR